MSLYAQIQDVRNRGVTPEAAGDEAVSAALVRATRAIDAYTGRDFLKREATYQIDGTDSETVFLDDRPVIEVLELRVDGWLLSPEEYVLYPDAGFIRLAGARRNIFAGFPGTFPRGARNVEIHGFFGFEVVPPEVNEAAIRLAIEFLRTGPAEADVSGGSSMTTRKAIGISRVRIDDLSVDFEYPSAVKNGGRTPTTGIPEVDAMLVRFRRDFHPIAI